MEPLGTLTSEFNLKRLEGLRLSGLEFMRLRGIYRVP